MGIARSASPTSVAVLLAATLLTTAAPGKAHAQMLGQPAPQTQAPPPVQNGNVYSPSDPNSYPTVQQAPPMPPPPGPPPPAGWIPTFDSVLTSSASQTAFTFDRNLLGLTDSFFAGQDSETRRIVAGLNSISVRTFHANEYARYDPGALAMIDGQYRAAGWKHLVNANGRNATTITDLWLHYTGANINGLTVLNRGDRNMTVINVDCTLRPLDLLHLGGHFGIPKVDENAVMVPAH
ncbi:hypothetical protein Terro_3857 [Terriglobus roseus DSM 18391]|uniref:Uncharacterized protein n=1 Tax=Terriglobus roseus (strain DSM 18391 / NRRL B-41598 / KBS 63) TaxID=926566 RepID=I3ZLE8_TERRK|nr:hypothetical protein [Terriglobus roseus]AFL90066.1 hypothetical protein Terro_3857 [Terriglobus roseus DSM 18391]